jgi:hypothetical protein
MSHHQNVGKNHNMKVANNSLENGEKFWNGNNKNQNHKEKLSAD